MKIIILNFYPTHNQIHIWHRTICPIFTYNITQFYTTYPPYIAGHLSITIQNIYRLPSKRNTKKHLKEFCVFTLLFEKKKSKAKANTCENVKRKAQTKPTTKQKTKHIPISRKENGDFPFEAENSISISGFLQVANLRFEIDSTG